MTIYLSTSPDAAALAERCAEVLDVLGGKAMEQSDRFVLALSGGSTPRAIYRLWAERSRLDWSRVVLVFGDERCVPPEHEQSNYAMVAETLLANLPAPPHILRMEGEHDDPAQAARNYEHALRELLGDEGRIHVALLGLGGDGHTASLFPGMDALRESDALCVSTPSPNAGLQRITLTAPCLREARKLMFIVAGADKAAMLQQILEGPLQPETLPAQFFLRDDRLNVNLLMDEAAAANLSRRE